MSKRMQRRCYRYWCFERDAKVKPKGYYKCWFTRCLYYTSVMGAFKVIVSIAIIVNMTTLAMDRHPAPPGFE